MRLLRLDAVRSPLLRHHGLEAEVILASPSLQRPFEDIGDSGLPVFRKFCPQCGSPIVSEFVATPELDWLKAGTLDDPSWLGPQMTFWSSSAQPWVSIDDAIPAYTGNPPLGG